MKELLKKAFEAGKDRQYNIEWQLGIGKPDFEEWYNEHESKNSHENANGTKQVLSAMVSDAEYIQELEGLVCFLARCYEKIKETYFDKHMETCSVENPNRRDLTEAEQSEWQRFPMIQGSKLQNIVSDIAKANKPNPKNTQDLLRRFIT